MKQSQIVETYLSKSPETLDADSGSGQKMKMLRPSELIKKKNADKKKRIKVLIPSQIINKKREIYEFEGRFFDSFGHPERHAKWFITGPPYSGKSSMIFILCQMLIKYGKIDYNNHEEAGGDADTVAEKLKNSELRDTKDLRLYRAHIEDDVYETFEERLAKRNSAAIAVLDSIQHAMITKAQYIRLTEKFCNTKRGKMMFFISHWVKNDFVKFVEHDCDIKIQVIGFVAHVESRCRGAKNTPFVIWPEKAKEFWGKNYKKVIEGKYWPGIKK